MFTLTPTSRSSNTYIYDIKAGNFKAIALYIYLYFRPMNDGVRRIRKTEAKKDNVNEKKKNKRNEQKDAVCFRFNILWSKVL